MADAFEGVCILSTVCNGRKGALRVVKRAGIETLIKRAKDRGDKDTEVKLKDILYSNDAQDPVVEPHKSCYCTYISQHKINRFKDVQKRKKGDTCVCGPSKHTRSSTPSQGFQYKTHCLFCELLCHDRDPKNPKRWKKVIICASKNRFDKAGNPYPSFKEVILCVAEQRNDELVRNASRNCRAAIDLPAVEARYHRECYTAFCNIPERSILPDGDCNSDKPLQSVVYVMKNDISRLWTSLELHSVYTEFGGVLSRRTMIDNLVDCLGQKVVVVGIEGCASIIGFRDAVVLDLEMLLENL